jgi:hypothetical protein
VVVPVCVLPVEGAVLPLAGAVPAGVGDDVPEVEFAALGSVGVAVDVPFVLEVDGGERLTGVFAVPAGSVRLVGAPGPYNVLS